MTELRTLLAADWPAVAAIYAAGIATGRATFETAVPSWQAWDAARLPAPRLVIEHHGRVTGWAALTAASSRSAYAGVADVSIFVDPASQGRGLGGTLLAAMVTQSEAAGLWTLQAGILADNAPSLALHVGHGFRVVGRRERIGRLAGLWRDVVLLERRSPVVGI